MTTGRPLPMMMGTGILIFFVLLQNVLVTKGQGTIPILTCEQGAIPVVPEDTAIGERLFYLQGEVHSGSYPSVNLTILTLVDTTAALVNVTPAVYDVTNDHWTSDVILIAELDRDFESATRTLSFSARDTNGNSNDNVNCVITISDVNDNAPIFQEQPPYGISVKENTTAGTQLLSVTAIDPDSNGLGARATIYAQFADDDEVNATFSTPSSSDSLEAVMNITLTLPLDYETRTFYTFDLMAVDGLGLNKTTVVTVNVIDVQDTPPFFLLPSYRAAIRENEKTGTYIIKVSAEDGDRDPANAVTYSFVNEATGFFGLDNETGVIRSLGPLDREDSAVVGSEGVFRLTVRATETSDVTPQYGNVTADVMVMIVVEDVNDHAPTFLSNAPYTAFVREDSPTDSLLYFTGDGYITVSDADQGSNAHFNLTVERDGVPWDALEATPSDIFSEALVLLRVKDTNVFRENGGTTFNLQLVAREISTDSALAHSSTAELVITVERAPEPPPTQAPYVDNSTTASDVVVFIIGFLVVFNIAATVFIVWFIRKRGNEPRPRQGLDRQGSKYYVNGGESGGARSRDGSSALTLRPESILVQVEGKDRCDVVPLTAVLAQQGSRSALSSASHGGYKRRGSAADEGGNWNEGFTGGRPSSPHQGSYDAADQSSQTERKGLVANEVSPARKSTTGSSSEHIATSITDVSVPSSQSSSPSKTRASSPLSHSKSAAPVAVNFSMARRNVSTPSNPALSFTNPAAASAAATASPSNATSATTTTTTTTTASSFPLPTTAFPSDNRTESMTTQPATTPDASPSPSSTAVSHAATHAAVAPTPPVITITSSPSAQAATPVEPVTRFSARGTVSTSIKAVPGYAVASSVALPGGGAVVSVAGSGNDVARQALADEETGSGSHPEMLY